jgi:CheY-like chemotaxis protein
VKGIVAPVRHVANMGTQAKRIFDMTTEPRQVLVIDDDELARLEIARCVEQQSHVAILAEHGGQGLELLRSRHFDLVLLDLVMPEIDGFEVLRQIKEDAELRSIPVIVITAVGEPENAARCMEMGAYSHMNKPVDFKVLGGHIKAICQQDG